MDHGQWGSHEDHAHFDITGLSAVAFSPAPFPTSPRPEWKLPRDNKKLDRAFYCRTLSAAVSIAWGGARQIFRTWRLP